MATLQFDLVSPERRLASLEASEVRVPGCGRRHDGHGRPRADHHDAAPRHPVGDPPGGTDDYVVLGGFADISGTGVTVLAERAMPKAELTREAHAALVEEYTAAHDKAKSAAEGDTGPVDAAAKLLADMVALGDQITA
jgi:F-type H+-transporting ATPase subunit epsilon